MPARRGAEPPSPTKPDAEADVGGVMARALARSMGDDKAGKPKSGAPKAKPAVLRLFGAGRKDDAGASFMDMRR
jgi:hypothetical protein